MSFSAEEQLMLLAARSEPDADARAAIRDLVGRRLDWDRFVETAVRHGVAPLAHRGLDVALGSERAGALPAPADATLQRLAATSATRNARLFAALAEVLEALGARGIRPLALKDLGLALEVFPEPGLRPLGDLDLLIAREEYDEAVRAMAELGYESLMPRGATFTRTRGWGHHVRRERDNVWIDLQWNVLQREWGEPAVGRRSFDPDVLRAGARGVALPVPGDPELLVSSPEATLFHLCSHLEGHEYGELILFCDIAESLRRQADELDWQRLVAIADRFEARATVYHVLELTRRLLGARVPETAMTALSCDVFRGGVFPAIFGGLGALHYAVDDIQAKLAPAPPLMHRLEAAVRGQAANARSLYDEVDGILGDFGAAGGELMVLASTGAGRRFPDRQLDAFGTVQLVVLDHDAGLLKAACAQRGYADAGERDVLRSVRGEAGVLDVRITTERAGALFDAAPHAPTNREIARQSLATRLRRRRAAHADVAVIKTFAVDRAELVVWLVSGLGDRRHDALFAVPPLLDVLRTLRERPAAQAVVARAASLGRTASLQRGVALAGAVAADDPLIAELATLLGGPDTASGLEWAREGPDVAQAQKDLRDAYLAALCLLQARRGERRPLLRGMTRSRHGEPAQLASIAGTALRALRRRAQPAPRPPDIYWLEG